MSKLASFIWDEGPSLEGGFRALRTEWPNKPPLMLPPIPPPPPPLSSAAPAAAADADAASSGAFDGVYLKLNATVSQVAAYADERCGGNNSLPAVRAACDALVECVGFTFAAAEEMCHTFILEEYGEATGTYHTRGP